MKKETATTTMSFRDIFGPQLTKEEALQKLKSDRISYNSFLEFPDGFQDELLDFIMGKRSLYATYDVFFKHILSPINHPNRLEDFISATLGMSVEILDVLPNEGYTVTERGALIIMDIIIRTSDGSIINVEMQKIGHSFPGQRAECYIADSIIRQYKYAKEKNPDHFSYSKIRPSYLIILMEDSPIEFRKASPNYIHIRKVSYNTGIKLPSLENIHYISLDTFNKVMQNKDIESELDAWLTFFSCTDPVRISRLIKRYPKFTSMYQDISRLRLDMKGLINMLSSSLAEADYYNELYMIREMKKEKDVLEAEIANTRAEIADAKAEIADAKAEIADKDAEIASMKLVINNDKDTIKMLMAEIEQLKCIK